MPAGTANLSDNSYYYANKPAFVQDYQWGKIGLPQAMNTARVPATDRFEGNALFAGACGSEDFYAGLEEEMRQGVLYPNPAQDILTVQGIQGHTGYEILDLQGRSWCKGNLNADGTMHIAHLPFGLYLLHIGNYNLRFVKS